MIYMDCLLAHFACRGSSVNIKFSLIMTSKAPLPVTIDGLLSPHEQLPVFYSLCGVGDLT